MFQSTRPRGARPSASLKRIRQISSFNPRARVGRDASAERHAPVPSWMFQSTRPRGARLMLHQMQFDRPLVVSIHAPAWGATCSATQHRHQASRFQSTRPRGARHSCDGSRSSARFQSTRPRGARRCECGRWDDLVRFQSTRPRGARPTEERRLDRAMQVSIHAPAWGATRGECNVIGANSFNPRARVGRDASHRYHLA